MTMKKMIMVFALLIFILTAQPASAIPYSGAWSPNDGDMFAIELSFTSGTGSLYLYDFNEGISDRLLVLNDGMFSSQNVYFSLSNGDWHATTSFGGDVNLGSSLEFGFLFMNGTGIFTSYDLTEVIRGDNYLLTSAEAGMTVAAHDAAPARVPEPGTLLLLGSGILGAGFFIRRKKT